MMEIIQQSYLKAEESTQSDFRGSDERLTPCKLHSNIEGKQPVAAWV